MNESKDIFEPFKAKRTFEEVSQLIKDQIFKGVFKPGDKLPPEAQLAKQLNLGRQTIREALRLLELSGFITVQKGGGGGPVIKDTILQRIGDLFLDAFRMKKISMEELTEVRSDIERIVLGYVIDRADESDIKRLKKNVREARKKIDRKVPATQENFQFHRLLAEASKNHLFVIVMESIMAAHSEILSRSGSGLETSANVVAYHEDILRTVVEKDRNMALQLLEKHIKEVGRRLKSGFQSEGT
jgi:GntR family transcriptional repressor for pyruvate dehydrogenase complex